MQCSCAPFLLSIGYSTDGTMTTTTVVVVQRYSVYIGLAWQFRTKVRFRSRLFFGINTKYEIQDTSQMEAKESKSCA